MNRSCFSIIVGLVLIFLRTPVYAQLPATKPRVPLNNAASLDKSDAKAEADRIAKERREQARSLLISLASDARSFRDLKLRARSLAQIADTLWSVDGEQARTLFRRAWEAAEAADENQEPYNVGEVPLDLRREVLKLAGRHDRLLAEEFLQKLKADQKETKAENPNPSLWALPEVLQHSAMRPCWQIPAVIFWRTRTRHRCFHPIFLRLTCMWSLTVRAAPHGPKCKFSLRPRVSTRSCDCRFSQPPPPYYCGHRNLPKRWIRAERELPGSIWSSNA